VALTDALVIGPDATGRQLCLSGGRVVTQAPEGAARLPCPDGRIAAGAVCAHTHLYSGLAVHGMPAAEPSPTSFLEILQRVWWRLDRALDEASLAAAATDYVARALLAGTTTLVDHHESPCFIEGSLALLAGCCDRLGMRALLCYGATERNFGRDEARRGLAECASLSDGRLVQGLVGLHAGFTVSDQTIRDAGDLARSRGTVLHVHVAEDGADVEDAKARGYRGPLERLQALGALVPGSILAHGVHLDEGQVGLADGAGCWLVHNPRSNEGNRVGYAKALAASRRVALGTDGWAADMALEQAALERLGRHNGDQATAGRLAAGYRLAAERFGAAEQPLTHGALGDLVVRENGHVRHVIVDGRLVVQDGMLAGASFSAIHEEARAQAARLWTRMAAL
jgi:cytosine/adenosine deaminase-related metal-dependent hydrolase